MPGRHLADLAPGESARVVDVTGEDGLRLRLLEMGFVPGTLVKVVKRAPFGDPLELQLRGSHTSLRRAEAARIEVGAG
ncbi:MAG TPA: FeoA family protein [Nannocystaceae bacterium]|nr:FeoA family protein [Nannocystaceae bacterium]